jgi:hypothetical protein
MLRLAQGIVLREGATWRFVCSQTYGGKGQDLAGAVPGGGAAVAVPSGIVLMQRDGSFVPHPDPEASLGTPTAFAVAPGKLYAVRRRERVRVTDVIEITPTSVRVIWTDSRYWNDLAVGAESLTLVRFEGDEVDELRLSFSGEVRSEQKASLVDPLEVSVRVIGDTPYYTAKLQTSTVLARIEQGTWKPVVTAGNGLAGPLELPDGTVLVALDGVLSTLANDVATPLPADDFVIGLSQIEAHPYACTRTGLREVSSTSLGANLFDLAELHGPDGCLVPAGSESDCELEWQHFQVELLGANIPLASADPAQKVCGGTTGATAMGALDAGVAAASASALAGTAASVPARAPAGEAGTGATGQTNPPSTATQPGSGCACGIVPQARRTTVNLVCYALVVLGIATRLRRRRRSGRVTRFRC